MITALLHKGRAVPDLSRVARISATRGEDVASSDASYLGQLGGGSSASPTPLIPAKAGTQTFG
jgi:hypothetical protein